MFNRRTILIVVAALIPTFGGTILVLGRNSATVHPASALRASAAPSVKLTPSATPTPTPRPPPPPAPPPRVTPKPPPPAPTRPPAPIVKPPVVTVSYFNTLAPGSALPSDAT